MEQGSFSGGVAELIQKRFGVKTTERINPVTATALTTVTKLAANNPRRTSLLIINIGSNNIYLSPSNDVSSSKGILLVSNGGSFSTAYDEDLLLPCKDWYAIASGANSNVYVLENVLY